MQRMAARVFAALLASDGRLDDLGRTGLERSGSARPPSPARSATSPRSTWSAASASPAHGATGTGLHNELWYETFTNRDRILTRWEQVMRDGVASAGGPDTAAGARMAETAAFFAFLHGELSQLMDRWREHRTTLDLPPIPPR